MQMKLIPMLFGKNNTTNQAHDVSAAEIDFSAIHAALKQMGFKSLTSEDASLLVGKYVIFATPNTGGYKLFGRTVAELTGNDDIQFQRKPVSINELSKVQDTEAKFDPGYYDDILCVGKFQEYMYLPISDNPITSNEDAKAAGFKQLSEVNPSDLPLGTLILQRHKNVGNITPVIVRVMGKTPDGDTVLLGWQPSSIVAGQWNTFRMVNTEENQFGLYEILVLS